MTESEEQAMQLLDEWMRTFNARDLAAIGWHHSEWDHRKIIHTSDDKIHFDTCFTRYREDGSKIGVYESIYIVTKQDGHWGVQGRSSFAP